MVRNELLMTVWVICCAKCYAELSRYRPIKAFTSIKAKSDQESTLAAYPGKGMAEAGLRRSVDGGGLTAQLGVCCCFC
jgi:hypothetical protein